MNTQNKNLALPIAVMMAQFFIIAFVTNLQTPFANVLKEQFHLANWQSLLGNMAVFLAYAIMGIPSGLLLQRVGYRATALTAITVGLVGVSILLASGYIGSFAIYLCGALVSGFSMCLLNSVVNPMLNIMGGSEKRGNQLLLFGGVFNSTGGTIAPIFAGILMGQVVNPQISDVSAALYLAMAVFALSWIVLYFVKIPEPFVAGAAAKGEHSALSFRHFRFGVVAIFTYVGVEIGIQAIAFLYLTSSPNPAEGPSGFGFDKVVVGTIIGTYWLLMLVGRLLGGIVASKLSSRVMLASVTLSGVVLVLVAMFAPQTMVSFPAIDSNLSLSLQLVPLNVVFLMLCGLCTSVMWPAIFNLATSGLGKYTAMASGIFMVMVVGGGILPAIQGYIADKTDFLSSYWVIVAGLLYMFFFAIIGSRNVNKDIDVQ